MPVNVVKNTTLVGFLCASLVTAALPAAAQSSPNPPSSTQTGTELPGGIRATTSADAQLTFLGRTGKVSRLRLSQGTAQLTVPPGTELKLEAGGWVVQSKLSDLEVALGSDGKPQVTCFSGLVGVTDASGAHFRLYPDSVLSMGADGRTPAIRSRASASVPVSTPAPAAEKPPVVTQSEPDSSTVYVPPDRNRYTPPQRGGNYNPSDDSQDGENSTPRRRGRYRDRDRGDYDDGGYRAPQPQGPNTGQVLMQNLPGILVNVLPYLMNRNQGYYYPNGGYYPNSGYYPNGGGYYPNGGGYYPSNGFPFPRF